MSNKKYCSGLASRTLATGLDGCLVDRAYGRQKPQPAHFIDLNRSSFDELKVPPHSFSSKKVESHITEDVMLVPVDMPAPLLSVLFFQGAVSAIVGLSIVLLILSECDK